MENENAATETTTEKSTVISGAIFDSGDLEQDKKEPEVETDDENKEVVEDGKEKNKIEEDEETKKLWAHENIQKRFNKITREKYEAEERAKRIAAEKAELEKKLAPPEPELVPVPPLPDYLDDEETAKAKMDAHVAAVKKNAEITAQKNLKAQQAQEAERARIEAHNREVAKKHEKFYERAETMGLQKQDVQKAEDTFLKYVNHPDLVQHMLDEPKSSLIITELSKNLDELEKISKMTVINAAIYLDKLAAKLEPKKVKKLPDELIGLKPSGSLNNDPPVVKSSQFY